MPPYIVIFKSSGSIDVNHKTFLCVCVDGLIRVNRIRYSAHRTRHEC